MLETEMMWEELVWGQEGVIEGCFRHDSFDQVLLVDPLHLHPPSVTALPLPPPTFPLSPSDPATCSLNTRSWILPQHLCTSCYLSLEHSQISTQLAPSPPSAPSPKVTSPLHPSQTLATRLDNEPDSLTLTACSPFNFLPPHTIDFTCLLGCICNASY